MDAAPDLDAWAAWHPSELLARFGGSPVTWYVAGGWAIDLHLGRQTREHEDIEAAIPRTAFGSWRTLLSGFDLYEAVEGQVRRLEPGVPPDRDTGQIWVFEPAAAVWRMDTFLQAHDATTWSFHRDAAVTVALVDAVTRTADGVPYLRPQFVLLAKAKHRRSKDEADFAMAVPTLEDDARAWLAATLSEVHPGHVWIDMLRR